MSRINRIVFRILTGFVLGCMAGAAQPPIRASEVRTFQTILSQTSTYVDQANHSNFIRIPVSYFSRASQTNGISLPLTATQMNWPHYLRFAVCNDQPDTAFFYFYNDLQEHIQVQQESKKKTVYLTPQEYEGRLTTGTLVFRLVIPPQQTITYITKIIPLKSRFAEITPTLIRPDYVPYLFKKDYSLTHIEVLQFQVFCGMLAMMLLYIFFKFVQVQSKEYLYYAGYIFCFLFYFFLKGNALNLTPVHRIPIFSYYLVNITQVWAYCLYFSFFRQFLNVSVALPRLNKALRWFTGFLLIYTAIDLILYCVPATYAVRWIVWDLIRISLIVFCVVALFMIIRLRNKLMHYIFAGSIAMSAFGLVAMVFSMEYQAIEDWPPPLNSPLLYFQLGITIELLCFSLGLGYKNRRDEVEKIEATEALKYERDRQAFERYKATVEAREAERRRIASEMHDDIGSGLTSILFLSNAIHRHARNGQAEATEKITSMATGLVDKMNNIIWSMNKEYDSLPDLIAYVRSHISELLDNADLPYQFEVLEPIPDLVLNGEQRRNIYLVIKEAVHNTIKHAHASQVRVCFQYTDKLEIQIVDNGIGLTDRAGRRFGNGLKNMRQRMQDVGGILEFLSETGEGTTVSMTLSLSAPRMDQ